METFYDFFFILGIMLCLSFIFILYRNNNKNEVSHKLLSSILTIFIFIFLNSYAGINNVGVLSVFTTPIVISAKIVIPTLLFFYTKSLFFEDNQILKKHKIILFFPILFLALFIIPCSILDSTYQLFCFFSYYDYLEEVYKIILLYRKILPLIRIISNMIAIAYLIMALGYFFKLKKVMQSNYSYIGFNNFVWIRFILIFPLIIVCVDSIFAILEHFFFLERWQDTEIFTSCLLVVSILCMGYFGIKQTKILVPYFLLDNIDDQNNETKTPKNKNPLSQLNTEFENLTQQLNEVFKTKKPYLNTDLTLGKLAQTVGTTDKKMSALLNQHLQISFYEFVNNYRIDAFKKALQENQYKDYTIEAISAECGFKSKASFYRIFKAKTNMSPVAYKKSLQ